MTTNGKSLVAALNDSEALAAFKPGVALFCSPENTTKASDEFVQPSEVQFAYDSLKTTVDAAHPSDSKLIVNQRKTQRKVFNETMGNFVDFVAMGARKDPNLPVKFGLDFLLLVKSGSSSKSSQSRIPVIALQAEDKDPGTIRGKVRGGVRKALEIYRAYDDPTLEANWAFFDTYANASFTMSGQISGRRTYVRGRYILSKGRKSPWSDIVSIMVP